MFSMSSVDSCIILLLWYLLLIRMTCLHTGFRKKVPGDHSGEAEPGTTGGPTKGLYSFCMCSAISLFMLVFSVDKSVLRDAAFSRFLKVDGWRPLLCKIVKKSWKGITAHVIFLGHNLCPIKWLSPSTNSGEFMCSCVPFVFACLCHVICMSG